MQLQPCPLLHKTGPIAHRLDALRAAKVDNPNLQLRLGAGRLLQQEVAGLYVLRAARSAFRRCGLVLTPVLDMLSLSDKALTQTTTCRTVSYP